MSRQISFWQHTPLHAPHHPIASTFVVFSLLLSSMDNEWNVIGSCRRERETRRCVDEVVCFVRGSVTMGVVEKWGWIIFDRVWLDWNVWYIVFSITLAFNYLYFNVSYFLSFLFSPSHLLYLLFPFIFSISSAFLLSYTFLFLFHRLYILFFSFIFSFLLLISFQSCFRFFNFFFITFIFSLPYTFTFPAFLWSSYVVYFVFLSFSSFSSTLTISPHPLISLIFSFIPLCLILLSPQIYIFSLLIINHYLFF